VRDTFKTLPSPLCFWTPDNSKWEFRNQIVNVNDKYYIGEWSVSTNWPHGFGIWFSAGFVYEGYTFEGKWVGMAWNIGNEWIYEGNYVNDWREGFATLALIDGERYKGEYWNGDLEGLGEWVYLDGKKYSGGWKDGLRHGYGVVEYPDGSAWQGWFKEGKACQKGVLTNKTGAWYMVSLKNFDELSSDLVCIIKD